MAKGQSTENVASQTEIPVEEAQSEINSSNSKFNLSNLPLKVVGGVILTIIVILIIGGIFLFRQGSDSGVQTSSGSLVNEASIAFNEGDYDTAEELVNQGLEQNGENYELINLKIKILSAKGNESGKEAEAFEESKEYLEKVEKTETEDIELLLTSGHAYEIAGDYEKALELYDRAIEINDSSSQAHFHRGHVLFFLSRYDEGKEEYEISYELDKSNPHTLIALGNISYSEGSIDDSIDYFLAASNSGKATDTVKAEALTAAAIAKTEQLTDLDGALEIAKQAVDLRPNFSPALAAYGYAAFLNGDGRTAAMNMEKAIDANPRITRNYNTYAQMLRFGEFYAEAIQLQNRAILGVDNDNTLLGDINKSRALAFYNYDLAKTYDMADIETDKIGLLRTAVELNPLLKADISDDVNNFGFFADIAGNAELQQLISE